MEVIVAFFLFALLFLRGLCVESVLQAKLVALAYHMWKHSHHLPGQKNLAGTDGRETLFARITLLQPK